MGKSAADRQREYRQRMIARVGVAEGALRRIIELLDGNDKPLAVQVRKAAEEGLPR